MSESLLSSPAQPVVLAVPDSVAVYYPSPGEMPYFRETPELAGSIALAALFIQRNRDGGNPSSPSLVFGHFDTSGSPVQNECSLASTAQFLQERDYRLTSAIVVGQSERTRDQTYVLPESTNAEMRTYGEALTAGSQPHGVHAHYAHYRPDERYQPHGEHTLKPVRLGVAVYGAGELLRMQSRLGGSVLRHTEN